MSFCPLFETEGTHFLNEIFINRLPSPSTSGIKIAGEQCVAEAGLVVHGAFC
jgi:hypothetical protein